MTRHAGARIFQSDRRFFERVLPGCPTTRIERLLLMGTIILIPAESYFPTVAGMSIMRLALMVMAVYIIANRPDSVARTASHPVFLAAYTFICLAFIIEGSHPYTNFEMIFRIGQMFVGAILVASLCRDRKALRAGMYGYMVAGIYVSVLLLGTTYGTLSASSASNFNEASQIRDIALADQPLGANVNALGFYTAQGVVVALAFAFTAKSARRRNVFLGIGMLCMMSTFLPMSRSAVVIAAVASGAIVVVRGVNVKTISLSILLGLGVTLLVPGVAFYRLAVPTEASSGGKLESRARIYTATIHHFPEYAITGVGAGNFHSSWGWQSEFVESDSMRVSVTGAHNVFAQVTIYWGLAALVVFMVVVFQAYRCIPGRNRDDGLALCLVGMAVSLLLLSLFVHNIYSKEFSLGLGLLVGARVWIWPQGSVRPAARSLSRFSVRHA